MTTLTDARARLRQAGFSLGPAQDRRPAVPWYLLVLQGIGGWLSALFLMGFLGVGFMRALEEPAIAFVLGLLLVGGAYGLLRRPHGVFLEQLVLAFSLAGQLLLGYAIARWLDSINAGFWFCLLIMHCTLAVVMASPVHRLFSAAFAALSLFALGAETGWAYGVSPLLLTLVSLLWLHEFRYPHQREALKFVAMGLTLALLVVQYLTRFPELMEDSLSAVWLPHWLGEWLTGATLGYLAFRVVKRESGSPSTHALVAGACVLVLLCLASSYAYGLTQGAVLIALGFAVSHRLLMGLGVVSLLFSLSTYYYRLDLTLLEKAATLLILGLALLALRAALQWWTRSHPREATHA